MKSPDIKEILLKQLDEYTKFHAEKYANYVMNTNEPKSYDEWKKSDCCGNSCGCSNTPIDEDFFMDDDEDDDNLFEQEESWIHERNPDTNEIRSRKTKTTEDWIIEQYNRNREAKDHITNINQIPKNEE